MSRLRWELTQNDGWYGYCGALRVASVCELWEYGASPWCWAAGPFGAFASTHGPCDTPEEGRAAAEAAWAAWCQAARLAPVEGEA